MRRFAMANRNIFFGLERSHVSEVPCPEGFVIVSWNAADVREHISEKYYLSEEDAVLIECDKAICFAVNHGESLAGYAWFAFGKVAGEMNFDVHPDTRLSLSLPDDTSFVFHVFVLPAHRGKRLYAALISHALQELQGRGINKLILTTECSNLKALRSVRRMGFQELGQSWLIKIGPLCRAGYPEQPFFGGVRTGKYAGDI